MTTPARILMALLLAVAALPASARPSDDQPLVLEVRPPQVPVVGSLADLKKLPEIVVADIPMRLGIESKTVPANSAVLAYCLWTPPQGQNYLVRVPFQGAALGPLAVRTIKAGVSPQLNIQQNMSLAAAGKEQLAVAPLKVEDPGKYTAEFYSSDGMFVGRVTLNVVARTEPNWYPLTVANETRTAKPAVISATVTLGTTAACPKWPMQETAKAADSLPTYTPASADPDFKASYADGTLTLTAKGPLNFSSPSVTLLTRWWINGNPVELAEPNELIVTSIRQAISTAVDVTENLKLPDLLRQIGAKTGDKVQVEVLYSQNGWDYANPRGIMRTMDIASQSAGLPLRQSNKLEFIAP